jgi:SAM-dependent methyltransferase
MSGGDAGDAGELVRFYEDLAEHYHLIFEDWEASLRRQGEVLSGLIARLAGPGPKRILDAACGIGTQAIGLALQGHQVTGSDLSPAAVARAGREAKRFGVEIPFEVADFRAAERKFPGPFDLVCAFDNAVAHLEQDEDLVAALGEMARLCRPGGLVLLSIRDYDALLLETWPSGTPERVIEGEGGRRRVFQVWDSLEGRLSRFRIVIALEGDGEHRTLVFNGRIRAITRAELSDALRAGGLTEVRWLMPEESGDYQPIVAARRGA